MSAAIQKKEKNTVVFDMTIDTNTFEEAINLAYKKIAKKVNIPGFRKGKAPKKLIELHYGESVFYDDAIDIVFPKEYTKSILELGLEPIDRPTIDIKEIEKGKDLVINVTVEVKPEAEVKEYKGLKVKKSANTVAEEDIENEIKATLEKYARIETVDDKKIEKGNIAVIDFKGFVDGVPFEGGQAEDFELEIGSGTFIEGFEDQLVDKTAGEDVKVNVTFPEDYHVENLKGKPAEFEVKVKSVKVKTIPELDDEFVKDISEFDTVAEYKEDLKKNLEEKAKQKAEREQEDTLLNALIANTEVEVPNAMTNNQIDNMVNNFAYSLYMQGLDFKQYLQLTGMTEETIRSSFKGDAEKAVKVELALEKVQKLEDIKVTAEEIDAELAAMAEMAKKDVAEYTKNIEKQYKNYREDIEYDLMRRKTIQLLKDNSIIEE